MEELLGWIPALGLSMRSLLVLLVCVGLFSSLHQLLWLLQGKKNKSYSGCSDDISDITSVEVNARMFACCTCKCPLEEPPGGHACPPPEEGQPLLSWFSAFVFPFHPCSSLFIPTARLKQ